MKQFLIFTVKIITAILVILTLLDVLYTSIYLQSSNRGKVENVYNSKAKNYDVIILGSSRANNHFVAPMFEEKGLKTFNYGMSGGHLYEASLLLKLMIERKYVIKNLILEADLNLSNDKKSEGIAAQFLPYIHRSKTIADHFKNQDNFVSLYYVPFYRYTAYENRIGFREMYKTAEKKPTNILQNLGYHPLGKKPNANMKNNLTSLKPLHNKYYEEIKHICKENNIKFIAIMTPMCENVEGLDYFQKVNRIYPEIHNYENAVTQDNYFSSCGHLNDAGAKKFTAIILKDFFNK